MEVSVVFGCAQCRHDDDIGRNIAVRAGFDESWQPCLSPAVRIRVDSQHSPSDLRQYPWMASPVLVFHLKLKFIQIS